MAQFVGIGISIEGKNIKQFSSLSISQGIFNHHSFRLVCPTEAIDGSSGTIFNASKNMIGGSFNAQIDAVGSKGSCQFSGVVTQIEAARHSGHAGDIIISGYSPTILLDNGPHCKTWEKKAVKNIAQDVLKHFPQNLLQPKINPAFGETLSYTVQYRETAWEFLGRLSATYGEWLYYDGQKLILGPPQGNKIKLIYGSNLHHFNMALQVRPANFQMIAYDYMNHEVYDGIPSGIAGKAGLNDFGKHTLQKSEKFYATRPKQWHNQFLTNKKQLDDFVNTRAAMQSSNMVRFNGSSGHPGIQVGSGVNIEGKNVFDQSEEAFGDYTIISVDHHCDGQGNYSNDFMAIPSSIKMPPVVNILEPDCETQSALVTDNHDPKGLGRVRVKFHWMNGSEKSPWIRVTTPHAGDDKGMFFIPEIGEEVITGFEGDSPSKPFIIGSVFHGKAKNNSGNGGNDLKALKTRSGSTIALNDKTGSVLIKDKNSDSITLDGAGNIVINSKESIVLTCGDAKIEMKKDGTININGKEMAVNGTNLTVTADKKVALTADDISIKAKKELELEGTTTGVKLSGKKVTQKADTNMEITGLQTKVAGTTQLDLDGGMLAKLHAVIVQIN